MPSQDLKLNISVEAREANSRLQVINQELQRLGNHYGVLGASMRKTTSASGQLYDSFKSNGTALGQLNGAIGNTRLNEFNQQINASCKSLVGATLAANALAMFSIDVKVSGDQIFDLSSFSRIKGKPKSTPRLMLHRVAANAVNLCAYSAQEAIIDEMAQKLTIRQTHKKGRTPSYIQNQVKIKDGKFAKPADAPNFKVTLIVQAVPGNSRGRTPIIVDMLNQGTWRGPFGTGGGAGKYIPAPVTENARQGGNWKGKVKTQLYYNKLAAKMTRTEGNEDRELRYISTNGKFYILKTSNGRLILFKVPDSLKSKKGRKNFWDIGASIKEEKGELIYTLVKRREVPKKLSFFDVGRSAVFTNAQRHFDDLVRNGGDGRPLEAQFKYAGKKLK